MTETSFSQQPGRIRTTIEFWPSFVDILVTVLMVFVLQSFLRTTLNVEVLEAAKLQQAQDRLRKSLRSEFQREVQDETVTFAAKPNLLQIRFADRILFKPSRFSLEYAGEDVLRRCARVLSQASSFEEIQIEGHTDTSQFRGAAFPRNNWELSSARALTVVSFFVNAAGLDPKKLSANGYGEFRPVVEAGRYRPDLSRRIELRVVFSTPRAEGGAK